MNNNNGKHLLAEFYDCQCPVTLLCYTDSILDTLIESVQAVGLTLVGQAVHEFTEQDFNEHELKEYSFENAHDEQKQSSGYTITLLLAESHICIHTWAELKSITLDIYVCNFLQDNSEKADKLLEICKSLFEPIECDIKTVWREHARPKKYKVSGST